VQEIESGMVNMPCITQSAKWSFFEKVGFFGGEEYPRITTDNRLARAERLRIGRYWQGCQ